MFDSSYFDKRSLLTDGQSNTKTAKNSKRTYYLSLQPTNLNTKNENLCRFSTKECREACLQFAGRQSFNNVVSSRERKTEFFVNDRNKFLNKLWQELEKLNEKGDVAVRLNLLSDINWRHEFWSIGKDLGKLSKIQLYDYTKDHIKLMLNDLDNYHLTLSFSGYNLDKCEKALKVGKNVAVVFKNTLPLEWRGYKVINGDLNDERYLDEKGVIVGLKYKTPKGLKYKPNKFVVDKQYEEEQKEISKEDTFKKTKEKQIA